MEPRKYNLITSKATLVILVSLAIFFVGFWVWLWIDHFFNDGPLPHSPSTWGFILIMAPSILYGFIPSVRWDGSQWVFKHTKDPDAMTWKTETLKLAPAQIKEIEIEKFSTRDKKIEYVFVTYNDQGEVKRRKSHSRINGNELLYDLSLYFPSLLGPEAKGWLAEHPRSVR